MSLDNEQMNVILTGGKNLERGGAPYRAIAKPAETARSPAGPTETKRHDNPPKPVPKATG